MTQDLDQTIGQLLSIHVGSIAPLGPKGVPSGFVKERVDGPVTVELLGLVGDAQADLSVHGGPEKAVYGYATSNYPLWLAEFPQHRGKLVPGGLGENLAIAGQNEESVYLGDIVAIGSAVLQVCQPRQPCFKFALRFEDKQMPGAMVNNGRSGWYYRVVQEGVITAGDPLVLRERPNPTWPMARFLDLLYSRAVTSTEAHELATMSGLASSWQAAFHAQLDTP